MEGFFLFSSHSCPVRFDDPFPIPLVCCPGVSKTATKMPERCSVVRGEQKTREEQPGKERANVCLTGQLGAFLTLGLFMLYVE